MAASDRQLLESLIAPVIEAGEAVLAVRAASFTVDRKRDDSPVTEADRRAEAILLAALRRLAPEIPVIAEEEVAAGRIPALSSNDYFLVDALDGTKDFVEGGNDFTVNVGLIRDGRPVLGVVGAPSQRRVWAGAAGEGAFVLDVATGRRGKIAVRRPGRTLSIVASRSHRDARTNAFIAAFPGAELLSIGSSLKFCLVAEGKADLYPRLGSISQWDIAAGDAVLRAAGGEVLGLDGKPIFYRPGAGENAFLSPPFVATAGTPPFA
jgi:3'(2'),5'-bisphosphate nucleotidase